jgi:hypothetical protein
MMKKCPFIGAPVTMTDSLAYWMGTVLGNYTNDYNERYPRQWFEWVGFRDNEGYKRIPDIIMSSTRRHVLMFICGLGYYESGYNKYVVMSSCKRDVLVQLDILLCNLGICGRISKTGPSSCFNTLYGKSGFELVLNECDVNLLGRMKKNSSISPNGKYKMLLVSTMAYNMVKQKTYDITVASTHSYLANTMVSHNTVYYKPDELKDIRSFLETNYANNFKSISFMLHSDHGFKQAPYEEITEKQYIDMMSKITPVSEVSINYCEDDDELATETTCSNGTCPVR